MPQHFMPAKINALKVALRNVFTHVQSTKFWNLEIMKIILKKLCFDNITRVSTLAFRWQTVLLYVFVIKETNLVYFY